MNVIKKIVRFILFIVGVVAVLFILLLVFGTLLDYKPDEVIKLYESDHPDTISPSTSLSLLTWNIGYAGLGSDMDFFYDGGKHVRTTPQRTMVNMNAIADFLESNDSMDFILLQEVDFNSKRSYHINELTEFSEVLKDYNAFHALNYKVFFVPLPFTNPMGKVNSGLVMFSKFNPRLVERRDFPGQYSWPKRLFMLDRCFIVAYYPIGRDNQLLVIDTHNSAFDDGSLKHKEMSYLHNFIVREQEKGNLIIIGGDWNQNPPGYQDLSFNDQSGYKHFVLHAVPDDFLSGQWTWAYDKGQSTNRSLVAPFNPDTTATTVLDFFLLSPGIVEDSVFVKNLGFENSDHNPVLLHLRLDDNPH